MQLSAHVRGNVELACARRRSSCCCRSAQRQPVTVRFPDEGKIIQACAGDAFTQVAERANVDIPLGCNQGNCGVCEVEIEKFFRDPVPEGSQQVERPLRGSGKSVIRSCIAKLPPGYERVDISLMDDGIWGVDGFDT